MTALEQSPIGAVQRPMRGPLFSAKSITRIATWNVRTLYQTGKLAQLLRQFDDYRLDILGIAEVRWTGSGQITSDGKTFVYSGHADRHERGVGFVLSKEAAAALVGWKPVSDRIITARFQTRSAKITVVQIYAPVEDADDAAKDAFYDQLQEEIDIVPRHDLLFVIGDYNAQLDGSRAGFEAVVGPHGSSTRTNNNGDRMRSFCTLNHLCVGNTFYAHKRIHKATWRAPGGRYSNEIDFVCINRRWRSSLLDVKCCRGADIGSDHNLLIAKCRLRLKRIPAPPRRPRPFNVAQLKDPATAQQFRLELRNRFEPLAGPGDADDEDVEAHWSRLQQAVVAGAEASIGRRRGTYKERWIQDQTWDLIDRRRQLKHIRDQAAIGPDRGAAEDRYRVADRMVKRSCRRDKRAWIERKGQEAQAAADRNDTKTLYRIVRELAGAPSGQGAPVRAKDGRLLLTAEEQEQRWIEHFQETLNQPEPESTFPDDLLAPADDLPVDVGPISPLETKAAIAALKSGRAPGLDEISPEMLKHGGDVLIDELTVLLNSCWDESAVPKDWRRGVIVKLPKKGNLADCNNWRGITLLSVPGKVLGIVLLRRLRRAVDQRLREEQAGFRAGRSCSEQIFILRTIIEQTVEFQQKISVNFIDFTKAFDSIHRDTLWKIARAYGIPARYVALFRNIYHESSCCVRTGQGVSDFFRINTGVRQGCVLSPFLFLLAMDFVMRRTLEQGDFGLQWQDGRQLADLDFADDIALLGSTQRSLCELTTTLEHEAAKAGLRISASKSKILRVGYARANAPVQVGQQILEEVDQFTYLGSVMTADGGSDEDITCRLGKAAAVMCRLRPIWISRTIALPTKIRLFNSIVIPTAIYACETWRSTAGSDRRLNVFQQRCLRRILQISYRDHVSNEDVYRRTSTRPLADIVAERRFRFAGHVLRLPPERLPKMALLWAPTRGRRKQGRPRTTWRRTFIEDLRAIDLSWDEAEAVAVDRARWRSLCAQCAVRRRRN